MKALRGGLALLLLAVVVMLPVAAHAQGSASITGILTYNARSALPPNAVVTVQLADVTQGNPPYPIVAEQKFSTGGRQVPFSFILPYDPARIDPNRIYSVQANISAEGRTLFVTGRQYRVITQGNPVNNITVVLVPTSAGDLPDSSTGMVPLGVAGLLALAAGGIYVARRRLVQRGE